MEAQFLMLAPQTILQKRYRIVRELRRGGMGAVYEAVDLRLTSKVALKEMLRARDEKARSAFEREAALLANLNHPNLPRVTDHFSEEDGAYLVMQFIEGMDLAEWLDLRGSPFPQDQVLQWADTLLDILEYLHGNNPPILHRDIKPSNVKRTEEGRIYLLDFGLAKGSLGQMPTYETARSVQGGTPSYAPLEQSHGSGTDPRSDLYSLGVTLYHLISGVLPAEAGLRYRATEYEEPDPLECAANFTSPNVAAVIEKSLSISPKHRPASAAEMRRALRHAAEEDARTKLKEEYRQAEDRRRQREAERHRIAEQEAQRPEDKESAAEEAVRQEVARQLQEAETKDKEQFKQRKVAESFKELDGEHRNIVKSWLNNSNDEKAQLGGRSEAVQKRISIPSTIPSPSVQIEPSSSSKEVLEPPVVTTISDSSPDGLNTHQDYEEPKREKTSQSFVPRTKQVYVVTAIIVAFVVVIGSILLVRWSTTRADNSALNQAQIPQASVHPNSTSRTSPTIKVPEGMVYVPGGEFMMGRDDGDEYERPAHRVTIKPFFIDINEVTNEDYAKFVQVTNHKAPPGWTSSVYPIGTNRRPVTGVTWDDANAYAKWANKRLPTEEEWEFAARGDDTRRYPWGSVWRTGLANADQASHRMVDVGTYSGKSPYGAFDMVGNAWEWTASEMAAYPGGKLPEQPASSSKVLRGGSFKSNKDQATVTYRFGWRANQEASYSETGFRCVKDGDNNP